MQLAIDPSWVISVVLVSIRLGALFGLTPVFAALQMPPMVRVWLLVGLSSSMLIGLGLPPSGTALSLWPLLAACVSELAVGALMAFGLFCAFAVFHVAGKLLDLQIGFSIGSVFDPATRTQMPLLGSMLHMLALALFFASDAHHLLLKGIAWSFHKVPPGTGLSTLNLDAVIAQFGLMFVLGLVLVVPVVLVLLLMDIGLGMISRTMPQLNIFVIGIPTKIAAGFLMLWCSLMYLSPVMHRVFASIFQYWQRLMG